jgi:hypothetical protein
MKNTLTITTQPFGATSAFLLEGDKERITQFHNAMYNHSATNGKLHDLGNGKAFYFYAQPEAVLLALTKVALFALCNKINAKGIKGGLLNLAKQKAQSKFDSIKQDRFLRTSPSNDTYNLGTISAEKPSDYCGAISSGRE